MKVEGCLFAEITVWASVYDFQGWSVCLVDSVQGKV